MLQQILRELWVEPEVLAELDDTQKQTLFCKMREEQVRRWRLWDQEVGSSDEDRPKLQKNGKKQVQFMQGEDGQPWVWVMGEHPDDKSIETMLAEEARERALTQARQEAHQLRKSVEKELTHLIDYTPVDSLEQKFDLSPKSIDSIEDNLDMYCTVEELRQRIDELDPEVGTGLEVGGGAGKGGYGDENKLQLDVNRNTLHYNFIEGKRDVLQELGIPNTDGGVSVRVAAWERRVAAARAGDILRTLRARRARVQRDAQLHAPAGDAAWREQERKAKEAEAAMRQIARAAREAHRRGADLAATHLPTDTPGSPPPRGPPAGRPASRQAVLEWFRSQELPRGVLDGPDPAQWFHGLISRSEAEQILSARPPGSFLVRISERVWGYVVSYRGAEGCRHYLVEVAGGTYRLLGPAHTAHHTLAGLIQHHARTPLSPCGGELLAAPCPPTHPPLFTHTSTTTGK